MSPPPEKKTACFSEHPSPLRQQESEINNSIKMEVGIEDCLHIEFEYNKAKYVRRCRKAGAWGPATSRLCARKVAGRWRARETLHPTAPPCVQSSHLCGVHYECRAHARWRGRDRTVRGLDHAPVQSARRGQWGSKATEEVVPVFSGQCVCRVSWMEGGRSWQQQAAHHLTDGSLLLLVG